MSDKKYHHGNLKIALIEAGIEMINECGEAGLSLRKVAAKCNVSQAAPYAHFKNKEDLIHAKQTPDKYKNLRVRVSGFSDYFVFLNEGLQDEIIQRTTHTK